MTSFFRIHILYTYIFWCKYSSLGFFTCHRWDGIAARFLAILPCAGHSAPTHGGLGLLQICGSPGDAVPAFSIFVGSVYKVYIDRDGSVGEVGLTTEN